MGITTTSFKKELGKNTGKWVSNKLFGDGHATPTRLIIQREREENREKRDRARAYKEEQLTEERARKAEEKEEKQLAKAQAEQERLELIQKNESIVLEHQNYIEVIQSVHKDYGKQINWEEILSMKAPKEEYSSKDMESDIRRLTNNAIDKEIENEKKNVKASIFSNLVGRLNLAKHPWLFKVGEHKITVVVIAVISLLIMSKSKALGMIIGALLFCVIEILKKGAAEQQAKLKLNDRLHFWEAQRDKWFNEYINEQERLYEAYLDELIEHGDLIATAKDVKKGEVEAYKDAIKLFKPFKDLNDYGSDISYSVSKDKVTVDFYVHEAIPSVTKKLSRNKLEVREELIPTSKYNQIYQDYVCSCLLRIAKDLFAFLPIRYVLVNAKGMLLNTSTGRQEELTIVSVLMDKETLEKLNFNSVDPSDSMSNFKCNMSFKKGEGFSPVNELV